VLGETADKPHLINKVDFGRKWLAAARTRPPATAKPNTRCISKKRAAKRAPKEALPQQGRLMHGRYGSRPSGGAIKRIYS